MKCNHVCWVTCLPTIAWHMERRMLKLLVLKLWPLAVTGPYQPCFCPASMQVRQSTGS